MNIKLGKEPLFSWKFSSIHANFQRQNAIINRDHRWGMPGSTLLIQKFSTVVRTCLPKVTTAVRNSFLRSAIHYSPHLQSPCHCFSVWFLAGRGLRMIPQQGYSFPHRYPKNQFWPMFAFSWLFSAGFCPLSTPASNSPTPEGPKPPNNLWVTGSGAALLTAGAKG